MAVAATLIGMFMSVALTSHSVPAGTPLHIRLTSTVGSYASTAGSAVSAVLIAPVIVDGETLLQAGSTLRGRIKSVTRVGLGFRHETASLGFDFNELTPQGADPESISTQVYEVDNSRERVTRDGRIHGIRSTSSLCYRVSGYIRTVMHLEPHFELAEWAIKSLIGELPEPEIYYPAGVELTLKLRQPLVVDFPAAASQPDDLQLNLDERQRLAETIAELPDRTYAPVSDRSADLTNILLVGTRDQILEAFHAAGWTQPAPATLRDRIHWIRAVAEFRGDNAAPMSRLLLDGAGPDMSWEKGLNDVSKRHHIRLWKAAGTWEGREMWIGAATHDVDFAYLRPGYKLSHKIDGNIDQERDKVAYDLAFSTCGSILGWADRPDLPRYTHNATGDRIATDGRMAVVDLNDCDSPRLANETTSTAFVPEHGSKLERFARREVLSARNDLIRTNPYWRGFEAARWLVEAIRQHRRGSPELFAGSAASNRVVAQIPAQRN